MTTTQQPTAPAQLTRREVEPTPLNGEEIVNLYAAHLACLNARTHAEALDAARAEIALLQRIRDARVRWRVVAAEEDACGASETQPPTRKPSRRREHL